MAHSLLPGFSFNNKDLPEYELSRCCYNCIYSRGIPASPKAYPRKHCTFITDKKILVHSAGVCNAHLWSDVKSKVEALAIIYGMSLPEDLLEEYNDDDKTGDKK